MKSTKTTALLAMAGAMALSGPVSSYGYSNNITLPDNDHTGWSGYNKKKKRDKRKAQKVARRKSR